MQAGNMIAFVALASSGCLLSRDAACNGGGVRVPPYDLCACPDGSIQEGQSCKLLTDSGTDVPEDESSAGLDAGDDADMPDESDAPGDADAPNDADILDAAEGERDAGGNAGQELQVQVATGTAHTCAVIESGDVLCWGANSSGQVGDGTRENRLGATKVPGVRARSVAAGGNKTCAVLDDGRVACWGGLAVTFNLAESELPIDLAFPPTIADGVEDAVAVAVSVFDQCALLRDRTVTCWDWKDFSEELVPPTRVDGIVDAIQIAAAGRETCAVLSDGKVTCWAISLDRPPAVRVSAGVQSLALGGFFCVLLSAGSIQCAGANSWGQLGNGTTAPSELPVSVLALSQVASISVGDQHACAVLESGQLYCWGNQAGFGGVSATAVTMPTRIQALGVVGVSASKSHTCIALRNGEVLCWGANGFGQIGDGTTIFAPKPRIVSGLASDTE